MKTLREYIDLVEGGYSNQQLIKDANKLFTKGGFKLVSNESEPRVDNPKKINTTYLWRNGDHELMLEIYNYAPNRVYLAVDDAWVKENAKITPDLAQKLWDRMERSMAAGLNW